MPDPPSVLLERQRATDPAPYRELERRYTEAVEEQLWLLRADVHRFLG
jgi:hypothetical protein